VTVRNVTYVMATNAYLWTVRKMNARNVTIMNVSNKNAVQTVIVKIVKLVSTTNVFKANVVMILTVRDRVIVWSAPMVNVNH